jgi:hypothetical protein
VSSESTTAMPGTSTGTTTALKEGADEIMAVSWKARWFGIGPGDPDNDIPRSRLIYPFSRFGGMWIIITSVFLVYTGIVTAPLVAFYWTDDTCSISPTLFLDVFIDSFFLVDIFITFKVGIFVGGEYIDNAKAVAQHYVSGALTFDILTSFPVSYFELLGKIACDNGDQPADTGALRLVRALKPFRLIKMARLAKVGRVGPIVAKACDWYNITPITTKLFSLMVMLLFAIHLVSCCWWLWKVTGAGKDELNDFLQSQAWGQHEFSGLETHKGKMEAYVISVYLTTMTLTTVGYGDIGADNTWERVGYTLLFIIGAFIWGELMAGMGEVHATATARNQERMQTVQRTVDFLVANDCPRSLRMQIVSWARFEEDHFDDNEVKRKTLKGLPLFLQKQLVRHLYSKQHASRVPIFNFINSLDKVTFPDAHETLDCIFIQCKYRSPSRNPRPQDLMPTLSDPNPRPKLEP